MKRRIFQATLLASALTLGGLHSAHAQQTIKLTAAGGHPPVFLWVKHLKETFIPAVDNRELAKSGKAKHQAGTDQGLRRHAGQAGQRELETISSRASPTWASSARVFHPGQDASMQNVSYAAPFGPTDNLGAVGLQGHGNEMHEEGAGDAQVTWEK